MCVLPNRDCKAGPQRPAGAGHPRSASRTSSHGHGINLLRNHSATVNKGTSLRASTPPAPLIPSPQPLHFAHPVWQPQKGLEYILHTWCSVYTALFIRRYKKRGMPVIVLGWQDKNRHTEGSALCAISKAQCHADGWQSQSLGPADNLALARSSANCDRTLSVPSPKQDVETMLRWANWDDILAGSQWEEAKKRRNGQSLQALAQICQDSFIMGA